MKATINGTRYDTSKADCICEYDNLSYGAESTTDFSFWEASLYRTKRSGRHFLAGRGGPMTQFAQSAGQNSWRGGERVIPLDSDREAMAWLEGLNGPLYDGTEERGLIDAESVIQAHFSHLVQEA